MSRCLQCMLVSLPLSQAVKLRENLTIFTSYLFCQICLFFFDISEECWSFIRVLLSLRSEYNCKVCSYIFKVTKNNRQDVYVVKHTSLLYLTNNTPITSPYFSHVACNYSVAILDSNLLWAATFGLLTLDILSKLFISRYNKTHTYRIYSFSSMMADISDSISILILGSTCDVVQYWILDSDESNTEVYNIDCFYILFFLNPSWLLCMIKLYISG